VCSTDWKAKIAVAVQFEFVQSAGGVVRYRSLIPLRDHRNINLVRLNKVWCFILYVCDGWGSPATYEGAGCEVLRAFMRRYLERQSGSSLKCTKKFVHRKTASWGYSALTL
jgi:hypothetical protein